MSSTPSKEDLEYGKRYERAAAEVLVAKLWPGAQVVERDTYAAIDFDVILDGKRIAFLEVKRRRVESTAFEDTAVNWKKYLAGKNLNNYFHLPVICLVVFEDRVETFSLVETPDRKEWISREDRDGQGCWHAFYGINRLEWHDELKEAIEAAAQA